MSAGCRGAGWGSVTIDASGKQSWAGEPPCPVCGGSGVVMRRCPGPTADDAFLPPRGEKPDRDPWAQHRADWAELNAPAPSSVSPLVAARPALDDLLDDYAAIVAAQHGKDGYLTRLNRLEAARVALMGLRDRSTALQQSETEREEWRKLYIEAQREWKAAATALRQSERDCVRARRV